MDCLALGYMTELYHSYRLWLPVVWMRLNQYNIVFCSLAFAKDNCGMWYGRILIYVEERVKLGPRSFENMQGLTD